MFKIFKKKRENLIKLGEFQGHIFYRIEQFGENIVERYKNFIINTQEHDKYGINKSELINGLNLINTALIEQKPVLAGQYLSALMGYVQLNINNDVVFHTVNSFVLIDDEPIDKMSPKHTEIKQKLFKEYDDVFVFFCEVFKSLQQTTSDSQTDISYQDYLKSQLVQISEATFSKLIRTGRDLNTSSKKKL